jgi:dTMP kinase
MTNDRSGKKGVFIGFEGIDGSGKSTQISMLCDYMSASGIPFISTREPGGTPFAEKIRALVLEKCAEQVLPMTEVMMFLAARHQHYKMVILPAIKAGKVVVCDRFTASTIAYQTASGGVSVDEIRSISGLVLPGVRPDLTILMDISVEESAKRMRFRGTLDRIEECQSGFVGKIRDSYLMQAGEKDSGFAIVDAAGDVNIVNKEILSIFDWYMQSCR